LDLDVQLFLPRFLASWSCVFASAASVAGGGCVVATAGNGIGDEVLVLIVVAWTAVTGVGYSKQSPQGASLQEVGRVDDEGSRSVIDNNIVRLASFVAEPTLEGYS
jgi:hypothetical protein